MKPLFVTQCPGLIVEDATLAEWLAAGGSPLAGATLEPMTPAPDAARPVTLTDDTVTDIWRLNNGR